MDPAPAPAAASSQASVELAPGVHAPVSALHYQFSRSSGPGGQNVNKLNTRIELWVPVQSLVGLSPAAQQRLRLLAGHQLTKADELHLAADTSRTQEANRFAVLDRLRQLLIRALHEPKPRRKTRPSRSSKRRRLEAKKHRGQLKASRRGQE